MIKNESPSEDNPWIQCDKCSSWIIASNDGIHDLSIYDDSNPNHLDYYCPSCRKKEGLDAPHLIIDDDEEDENPNKSNNNDGSSPVDSSEEEGIEDLEEIERSANQRRSTRKRRKDDSSEE